MRSEQYTEECQRLATLAIASCNQLIRLMRDNGDEARALDVAEAITYLESAVEES